MGSTVVRPTNDDLPRAAPSLTELRLGAVAFASAKPLFTGDMNERGRKLMQMIDIAVLANTKHEAAAAAV